MMSTYFWKSYIRSVRLIIILSVPYSARGGFSWHKTLNKHFYWDETTAYENNKKTLCYERKIQIMVQRHVTLFILLCNKSWTGSADTKPSSSISDLFLKQWPPKIHLEQICELPDQTNIKIDFLFVSSLTITCFLSMRKKFQWAYEECGLNLKDLVQKFSWLYRYP